MKQRTVNIRPFHVESKFADAGFVLEFYSQTGTDTHVKTSVHLELWRIKHIARCLWQMIAAHRNAVESAASALREDAK